MATHQPLPLDIGRKVIAHIRGESYDVFIRGWAINRFVVIDLPSVNGENVRVAPQTGCNINYIREGKMVSFKSSVVYSFNQALAMLIEYPKTHDIFNLRKNERFRASFPFTYIFDGAKDAAEERGYVRDVSMGGALLTHPKPLTKKTNIIINVTFPQGTITKMLCTVCNVRKNPKNESEPYVTGIRFINSSPENNEVIRKLLESRVQPDRRTGPRFSS